MLFLKGLLVFFLTNINLARKNRDNGNIHEGREYDK